jgi:hypothetical protein
MRQITSKAICSVSFAALLALSGCGYPGAGETEITRNAAPGAEVACLDTINRKLGKLGGAVVTRSSIESGRALVDLRTIEGTLYKCTSPRAIAIPYGRVAADASAG